MPSAITVPAGAPESGSATPRKARSPSPTGVGASSRKACQCQALGILSPVVGSTWGVQVTLRECDPPKGSYRTMEVSWESPAAVFLSRLHRKVTSPVARGGIS
ncbi:MAG: hypothetical protein BWY88_00901 [Synergistetes bacterium ADurb.Bin520]|nr:MAG: hypothetical protein BWY88_00901 [Synergistetes bacterium ADurb.Bin520]